MSKLVINSLFTTFVRGLPRVKCFPTATKNLSSETPRNHLTYVKYGTYGTLAFATGLGTIYYCQLTNRQKRKVQVILGGISRFFRFLKIGIAVSLDYWWSLWGLEEGTKEYEDVVHPVHQRSAGRILDACLKNGGLYIKLGQELSSHNQILPIEYVDTLRTLQDKCLKRENSELEEIFVEEFGVPHTEIFESFDEEPIAAASMAQVFHAKTKDGEEVAVKVQYIDLQDRFPVDVPFIKLLLKGIGLMQPNCNFDWVFEGLQENLELELDLTKEASNSECCARDLSKFSFIHVPQVLRNLSTKRILTTEFIHGTKVSNVESLTKQGFSLADIDQKLFKAFAEQIFHTGFIHADPHPGNVLVRKAADGQAEIVLLDHGLYQRLCSPARQALCCLWIAVSTNNQSDIKTYATKLGLDGNVSPFDGKQNSELIKMLKESPFNTGLKFTTEMAHNEFDQIMKALHSMPRAMSLVSRTLNIIGAISTDHGDPVNWYVVFTHSAFKSQFFDAETGASQRITTLGRLLKFELMLCFLGAKVMCINLYLMLLAYWRNEDK